MESFHKFHVTFMSLISIFHFIPYIFDHLYILFDNVKYIVHPSAIFKTSTSDN